MHGPDQKKPKRPRPGVYLRPATLTRLDDLASVALRHRDTEIALALQAYLDAHPVHLPAVPDADGTRIRVRLRPEEQRRLEAMGVGADEWPAHIAAAVEAWVGKGGAEKKKKR